MLLRAAAPQAPGLARPGGCAVPPAVPVNRGASGRSPLVPPPPTPPVPGSRDARAPLTGPGGVRQVMVGRSPGKLPQFPAAQAQHPGDRRLFQGSVDRAAPRPRARTRAQPRARPTVSTGEVSPGRHWARVLRSRYHSHQARGRHFPADNSPARLCACATRSAGWAGKGARGPRTALPDAQGAARSLPRPQAGFPGKPNEHRSAAAAPYSGLPKRPLQKTSLTALQLSVVDYSALTLSGGLH